MLQGTIERHMVNRLVAVQTDSAAFTQVLERLLKNWGFTLGRTDDPSALLLFKEGCGEPSSGQESVCLSFSHRSEENRLGLPVKVEDLWRVLEQYFHSSPRMHMRKKVDLPARVSFRGEWHDTHLSSLSDMGTRFSSDCELVKQEQVIIEIVLDGASQQYQGQVIFSMAEGAGEVSQFQSGVIFCKQDDAVRDELRCHLIRQYLSEVRDGMDLQMFQAGLAYFDLAPEVRRRLLVLD